MFSNCRINNREKKKMGHAVKANIVGKKLGWFAEQLEDRTGPLTSSEFEQMIERYSSEEFLLKCIFHNHIIFADTFHDSTKS